MVGAPASRTSGAVASPKRSDPDYDAVRLDRRLHNPVERGVLAQSDLLSHLLLRLQVVSKSLSGVFLRQERPRESFKFIVQSARTALRVGHLSAAEIRDVDEAFSLVLGLD
jgi:hypothetical protein